MSEKHVKPATSLVGLVDLPPDKSIAHRTALFSAMAEGKSRIVGFPTSADPQSTLSCLQALGIHTSQDGDALVVHGKGLAGFKEPRGVLDCGNSGTTMRLLSGMLAGQSFASTLTGDASLSVRPMARIIRPLIEMGASISGSQGESVGINHAGENQDDGSGGSGHFNRPPLIIRPPERTLSGISYRLPVASAQVKSCVLLAGFWAEGDTSVIETEPSRDHTERMLGLASFQAGNERIISVTGRTKVTPRMWSIPGDFSAAAFFMVAASLLEGSLIRMSRVGLNPTRTGLLDVLRAMGANIQLENEREVSGEPIADMIVKHAGLSGVRIEGDIIPNIIDEIPILCIAATAADGVTEIRGAGELRHKESDRIKAMVTGLRAMGANVEEYDDGLAIEGGVPLKGAYIETMHDHRIAMSFAIAALAAEGPTRIAGADIAAVSFPGFFNAIDALR